MGKRNTCIPALYFWRSCLRDKHTNWRNWGTEFMCDIVTAHSEQCHCQAETLNASNANNGKQLALLLEISRFLSSALALFMVAGVGMLTPKAAGGTWLPDPPHAVSPFNLLSSTNWTALLWEQLSAPPLLALGVNIHSKIFGSLLAVSNLLLKLCACLLSCCCSIAAFSKCFVDLLLNTAAGRSTRL